MSIAIQAESEEAVIVMTHTLDAPRELVWAAFTDPKHVVNWYGGHGFENPVCEMDVRPGGRWHHVMRTPDGAEHALSFLFVEVVKPEKLSWKNTDYGDGNANHPTSLNTLTLEEHGRQTKTKFVARFGSIAERNMAMSFGFASVLREGVERMAKVLEGIGRSA